MVPLRRWAVAAAATLSLAACGGPDWPDAGFVMVKWRAPGRTVACCVSDVVRSRRDVFVRVVSVSDVSDAGNSQTGATQGVNEVDIESSTALGSDLFGLKTVVHPREGLTWGDVHGEGDLVLETEPG